RADERLGGALLEIEVRLHAAAPVEQHDDRNRLDLVGEERQGLPLPVVLDGEVRLGQVWDQPALGVGHRRVYGNGPDGGFEARRSLRGSWRSRRRLLRGEGSSQRDGQDDGNRTNRADLADLAVSADWAVSTVSTDRADRARRHRKSSRRW